MIFKVRVLKLDTVVSLSVLLGVNDAFDWLFNIPIFDVFLNVD